MAGFRMVKHISTFHSRCFLWSPWLTLEIMRLKRWKDDWTQPASLPQLQKEGGKGWQSEHLLPLHPSVPQKCQPQKPDLRNSRALLSPKNIILQTVAITHHWNYPPGDMERKDTAIAILGWSREPGSSQRPWGLPQKQGQGLGCGQGLSLPLCQAESQLPNLPKTGHQSWHLTVLHNVLVLIRSS